MTKKLKKLRVATSNKSTKSIKPVVQPEKPKPKKAPTRKGKRKRKDPKQKRKIYNIKNFNNFAFPDKPVVDYGILDKKNYVVVKNENPNRLKHEIYFSKTLFKFDKKGQIKQFFIIQILLDKKKNQYTTYNRKGTFPNYGKGWRYDVESFNDALLDWYDTINICLKEGYEEKSLSELTMDTKKENNKIIEDESMEENIDKKEELKNIQKENTNKKNESIKKQEVKEKKKQFQINKRVEKEDKKITNINNNIVNSIIPESNNVAKVQNQNIFQKKQMFKCDKKESPKKFTSHSMPRFNVYKDESKIRPPTINHKSNEIFKLKMNFSGEAQQKQVNDIANKNMNVSNPSNPPESRDENEQNMQIENENNTMMEESENNAVEEELIETKINTIEKKENDKNEDMPKYILKLLKLIFDIKEAKKFLSFIGIDINSLPVNKFTNDLFIKALNKLNEIEKIVSSSKNLRLKNKKLYDLTKEYNNLIPHIYTIYNINGFLIDTNVKIQKELVDLDLIKSVSELDGQAKNFNHPRSKTFDSSVHKKKYKEKQDLLFYKSLLDSLMYNISIVDESKQDYKDIKEYLNLYSKESKYKSFPKLILKKIYRLTKKENQESKIKDNNNLILWYGCQIPQIYSILKNGFELPAKEAPDSSYIYGKGIMLSQNAFEQAQKCLTRNGKALLLGCSVNIQNADEVNDVTNFELLLKNKRECSIIRLSRHFYKDIFDEEKKLESFFTYYNYMVYDLSMINISYIVMYKTPKFSKK